MESLTLAKALEELRKGKERKFNQTVDLIVNLKGVDLRKTNISIILNVPHKIKDKRVCGFLTKKNDLIKTITKPEFAKYKDQKDLRGLVRNYDFFIAHASLMPAVATTFGKALGPTGKMPSPQLGIISEEENAVKEVLDKISKAIKMRAKESSIKFAVARSDMSNEEIIENITAAYRGVVDSLPTKLENVKNVMVKFTMTKPIGVKI
ncbi:MAG: ribosomal L1 domain-containing protein [Candidatus Pacearchaeota archaeon]|nr:ribosomal L1 domain-containing protein [Candidatus Pacearchaeota archaeon]